MDLSKELELYYNMVYAENITNTKLVNLLIVLKEDCEKILKFASFYDYDENHHFNGYRSTVLFVVKFLAAVHCTKLNVEFDGSPEEVIQICIALIKTVQSVIEFHENSLIYHKENEKEDENKENDKRKKEQVFKLQMPIDRKALVNCFESMQDNDIPFIFNKYYEFFYKGSNLNTINQTMLSTFLENFDIWSWFKTITSSTFTDTSLFLNTTYLGLNESSFGSSQLNSLKNWLPFLSSNKPYILETITIKRQLEWLICPITFELKHNPMKFQVLNNRKKFIKCKLLRSTVNSSDHLLIYFFSPDYFNKETDFSNSFLSDWSYKLPGCSILVPEITYDKNEKFVKPLQDCLDIYLWAIGKNNCVNKIELLNMQNVQRQFNNPNTNSSDNNLSIKRTNSQHSRSSSIGGLTSYFNNSSNSSNTNNSNSTVYSNPFKNCEKALDGVPEHITLSGDSSGGNLACSLLLVLNDLKTKFNFKDLKLPNALVLAFTPFNLRDYSPIMLTSRFSLYSLSPIIALTTIESNLPLPEIEDNLITLNGDAKRSVKDENRFKEIRNEDKIQNDKTETDKTQNDNKQIDNKLKDKIIKNKRRKKRSNSMNKYLIDRLNDCKLSDFFQKFGYLNILNDNQEDNEEDDRVVEDEELANDSLGEEDEEVEEEEIDLDDAVYNSAYNSSNDELNLSYFAKTLLNYLSQYYNTHEGSEELQKDKKKEDDQKLKSKIANQNIKTFNVTNRENEGLIQNAFTMFRLFFNGNQKKSNEFELNKEIVEKIFNAQREKAFRDLTSRPYISPAFYDDFQSLENVSIYLLNSTCDMYLDDNICMCKRWFGNVTLKVLEDQLPRGFLIERFLQDAKDGQLIFFKMIKESLELKKPLPKFLNNSNL